MTDRGDEDTKRVRRDMGIGARRASSVFPTPDAAHREVDVLDGDWREREAALQRENERLRGERSVAIAQRESYRAAVKDIQALVEKRDAELRILRKALGR